MSAMLVKGVFDQVFHLWGVESPSTAPASIQDHAADVINGAFQEFYSHSKTLLFLGKKTASLTLSAGTSEYQIEQTASQVLHPFIMGSSHLIALKTEGEFRHYAQIYNGVDSMAPGAPEAYWLDGSNQADTNEDAAKVTVKFVPTPDQTYDLEYDYVIEPPQYTYADYTAGTAVMSIPHKFVESLFLPIARRRSTLTYYFVKREREAAIIREYQEAIKELQGLEL